VSLGDSLAQAYIQGTDIALAEPAGTAGDFQSAMRFLSASTVRNALSNPNVSRAVEDFVFAAKRQIGDDLLSASVGLFDGDVYVWLIVPNVDVEQTRRLFALREAVASSHNSAFEIHVAPAQGRDLEDLRPGGFQTVAS